MDDVETAMVDIDTAGVGDTGWFVADDINWEGGAASDADGKSESRGNGREDFTTGIGQTMFRTTRSVKGLIVGICAQNSVTCCQRISDIAGEAEGRSGRSPLITFIKAAGSDRFENGGRPVYN
jgi:hypothetical protein